MDDKVLVVVLILLSCVVLSLGGVYASEDGSDTKNEFACCDMSDNAIYDNNLNSVCGGVDDSISQNTRVVDNLNDKNIVAENYGNNNGNGDVSKSMNTYGNLATDLDSISDYDFDIVTFTDLQGIINNANKGDTILLTQNYTYDSGFINTGISINKSLTIDGNGFTLDGAKSGRIFNINADGVVLKNLIMTNGNITDILILKKGGAISWIGSEGVIVNCTFINNLADQGGAIYLDGFNCIIDNSTFIDNNGIRSDICRGGGGAIYWNGNYGTVVNSTFINNNVNGECTGGAIYWNGSDSTISNSTFIDNCADNGGAIYYWFSNGDTTINDCTFKNNTATNKPGGAVFCLYNDGGIRKFTVRNSTFIDNSACMNGGAIEEYADNSIITNCTFINNTAACGGAISCNSKGNISDSIFVSNVANMGGAVSWRGENGTIINSTFINNGGDNEYSYGGAISWTESNGTVVNSTFINNTAACGGAIQWGGFNGTVNSSIFINNTAYAYGGAIYWGDYIFWFNPDGSITVNPFYCCVTNGTISNSNFINNYIDYLYDYKFESSVYGYKSSYECANSDDKTYYSNANFVNNFSNSVFYKGGAIYWACINGSLIGNTFNSSENNDIYINGTYGSINVVNVIFQGNKTQESDGSVTLYANVTDDKGNPVTGGNVSFLANGVIIGSSEVNNGIANFHHIFSSGNYVIFGNYSNAASNNIKNGFIIVKNIVPSEPSVPPVISYETSIVEDYLVSVVNGSVVVKVISPIGLINSGVVEMVLNGFIISKSLIINGSANLSVGNISSGNYSVIVYYEGNDSFKDSNKVLNLEILSDFHVLEAVMTVNNSSFVSCSGENYTVNLNDINGNYLVGKEIAINLTNAIGQSKVYWATTNTEGIAKLPINLAYPGVYNVTACYFDNITNLTNVNYGSITIYDLKGSILTAPNFNTSKLSGVNFTVNLKDSNGVILSGCEVSLTLVNAIGQNKTYWATTNTGGVAKLPINLGFPGIYYMICSFSGYKNIQSSNTVNSTLIIDEL